MSITSIGANRLLHVFGGEVIEYEETISSAFSTLCEYSSFPNPPAGLIHRAIRQIMTDSALVSLIFFPQRSAGRSGELAKSRADFLRVEFQVSEESLLTNRSLRNHMAHLDERLDKWAIKSTNKTFGRGMLGSRAAASKIGLKDEDILGLFDPTNLTFAFLSDDLRIDDLVGEIRRISHVARIKL